MSKNKKLYVVDGKGKKLLAKDITAITGLSYSNIRHYVRVLGAETIGDILKIVKAYEKGGKSALYQRKMYDTKFGFLNTDQMYEKFSYKSVLTKAGFAKRVSRDGSKSKDIWLSKVDYYSKHSKRKKKCTRCKTSLPLSAFGKVTYGDGRMSRCPDCLSEICRENYKKKIKLVPTKNHFTIKLGEVVRFEGKKYEVAEHLDKGLETSKSDLGEKAQITGFKIMGNGQVLRRTFVPLGDRWKRVSC